ncbi:DUF5131 family protein [Moorella sp. Hama-1]|uniref:DUF5131 family protein n=1 Tax=Moorella sp. Hama-1 TaxID=2138101 RepID=UPI000D64A8A1|nr:phage Gp37/Gp68 family protein [Moorella sp. Hama-1]BCV20693.1 hypothetical protein hamaS1_07620 [Moorella sp. Hama-1]
MATNSKIEWTEATWNPVTGCTKISNGCKHCYAYTIARRLQAMGNPRYKNGFNLTLHADLIDLPLKWKTPKKIFVNSMSDLFHEEVPFQFIERVFYTMRKANWHIFQILTKRSRRLREMAPFLPWPDNVWAGVTVEDQSAIYRINDLRSVPASVRFISFEPLLSPLEGLNLDGIHWAIVGGESGPGARPMETQWVRDIHNKCSTQNVSFFFKQWGGVQKHKNGRVLDNQTWDEYPEHQYAFAGARYHGRISGR